MNPFRVSFLLVLSLIAVFLLSEVPEADSIYAYAVKGIVKDVRLHPTRFIGGWFFKKAFILKKLKLKFFLVKKLILKKLLKKKLLLIGVGKLKGLAKAKILLPVRTRHFAHGWGPHVPLHYFRRKKRSVRFPDEHGSQSQHSQTREVQNFHQVQSSNSHQNDDYIRKYGIDSLGLSQNDLEQLRHLPESLMREYGQEMEHLEAAASEPKEDEIQGYFSVASEFDNSACIPKSICEIMARGNRTVNQFENQVLEYYGQLAAASPNRSGNPSDVYDYAAYVGRNSGDPRKCVQHFTACQDSPQALNSFMDEVFTPEMCESANSVFNDVNDRDLIRYSS